MEGDAAVDADTFHCRFQWHDVDPGPEGLSGRVSARFDPTLRPRRRNMSMEKRDPTAMLVAVQDTAPTGCRGLSL